MTVLSEFCSKECLAMERLNLLVSNYAHFSSGLYQTRSLTWLTRETNRPVPAVSCSLVGWLPHAIWLCPSHFTNRSHLVLSRNPTQHFQNCLKPQALEGKWAEKLCFLLLCHTHWEAGATGKLQGTFLRHLSKSVAWFAPCFCTQQSVRR